MFKEDTMVNLILGRSALLSSQTVRHFSYRAVRYNHTQAASQISHLFKEIPSMNLMSKEEFTKKKCMTFEDFTKEYGDFARKKGMEVNEAFQKMLEGQYNNYLIHSEIIEPGRIC